MDEWEIDKPHGQCCGSGKKIEYGQEYFAALVETEFQKEATKALIRITKKDFGKEYDKYLE